MNLPKDPTILKTFKPNNKKYSKLALNPTLKQNAGNSVEHPFKMKRLSKSKLKQKFQRKENTLLNGHSLSKNKFYEEPNLSSIL